MIPAITMLLALLTVSCVAETTEPGDSPEPWTVYGAVAPTSLDVATDEPDICTLLPETGACALACDPDQLAELIPDGSCAVFACDLTDGRRIQVHVCNPSDDPTSPAFADFATTKP